MINVLPTKLIQNLNQPNLFAVLASIGIHLLAFAGLQAATRQSPSNTTPASVVDVVELSSGDMGRLPDFVQQQLTPSSPHQSFALFPPLPGQTGPLPNPNLAVKPNGDPSQDPQFYSSNFNSPYLDTFLNTLPPPPPGGWFSGGSVPIVPNPVVVPGGSSLGTPNVAAPPPSAPSKPPAPTAEPGKTPQIAGDPRNSTPDPGTTIIEIPQDQTTIAAQPEPTPNPSETLLPSAVSEIQALQDQYRDRYAYNPTGTSVEEAQALLTDLLTEMRSVTGQADLQPEAGIQVKLAFPDPVCPRNASGIAIVALVDAQGYLIQSRLIRSSGYDVLDQQAMDNVNQRSFNSQANGRYTLYQYLLSFADLDGVCFTDNAQTPPNSIPPA